MTGKYDNAKLTDIEMVGRLARFGTGDTGFP